MFVRLALAASTLGFVLPSVASAAADAPSASCTSGLTRVDRRIGEPIPLPSTNSNPTPSTVTFKLRMVASYFFGPAHDVGKVTLPPHTGRIRATGLPTFLHAPLGGSSVVIEVRTDPTGSNVVGRCDYQRHLRVDPKLPGNHLQLFRMVEFAQGLDGLVQPGSPGVSDVLAGIEGSGARRRTGQQASLRPPNGERPPGARAIRDRGLRRPAGWTTRP